MSFVAGVDGDEFLKATVASEQPVFAQVMTSAAAVDGDESDLNGAESGSESASEADAASPSALVRPALLPSIDVGVLARLAFLPPVDHRAEYVIGRAPR